MKGQIFIVMSVLVAIALLGLSMSMDTVQVNDDYLQDYFVNVRTESRNTIENALLNGDDYIQALDDYILFSESILTNKGITQDITYIENLNDITVDIYLERGEEYYRDQLVIPTDVFA